MTAAPAVSSFPALGTTATVAVTDDEAQELARAILSDHLAAVDRACSRFRHDSDLVRANRSAGAPVVVEPLFVRHLRFALSAAASTCGLVDPTLGARMRQLGYDRTFSLVRERGTWRVVGATARAAGWQDVVLDDERCTVVVPQGLELDLGATAKARAADDAARAIAAATGSGVLVSLGGDVAVAGPPPGGGWPILVADDHSAPLDADGPRVAVSSGGLATSSTRLRRWRTEDGEAHHILDPRTGCPAATAWRTVSVAASSCAAANVAATAVVVLGEPGLDWLAQRGLPARCVRDDGSVVTAGGWPADAAAA